MTLTFTLYTRPGCHLCDDMKAVVSRVAAASPVRIVLDEIDISTDAALETRYGLDIPVLLCGGRMVAKHRLTDAALARVVADRSGPA